MITIDHPAWVALQNHLTHNVEAYLALVSAIAIASVCTMPERCPFIIGEIDTPFKQLVQNMWAWLRNTLQTAVPAARNHQNPTQPETPAKPK